MYSQDYQEGYCDGLSGIGLQDRGDNAIELAFEYEDGFLLGSSDRKVSLHGLWKLEGTGAGDKVH